MKEVTTCVRSSDEVAMSQDEGTFTMIMLVCIPCFFLCKFYETNA